MAGTVGLVLRLLLTPRWLLRAAVAVVLAGVCVRLGMWQWDRAQQSTGRGTNVAYAIEWFIFAAFVFFCLWHWLKDSQQPSEVRQAAAPPVDPLPHHARRPSVPAAAAVEDDDPELAAYNAYLARLNDRRAEGNPR